LASTIYRLETVQARQDFEQRALAAEEMSSIGEIAFGLTHRLDNDLGLVEAYIDDIREELKSQQITNGLITKKLENIGRAVRKVLDMSEALKGALTKSGEAINDETATIAPKDLFVEAKLDVAQLLMPAISCEIEIEENIAHVRAIPRLVVDILHNLIANAIQAIPKRGKITLKARAFGQYVALDVSDTGVGIPLANQSKIFSLFYTTKGGFGFGLWNARRNALKNGGDLKVLESQPGRGTTFRLLLPKADR
jgi:signal transduction histidine kinase